VTGADTAWTDERLARWIGNLLRLGVAIAAAVVLAGGVLYLARHGMETPSYHVFHGEPSQFRSVAGILGSVTRLGGRGLIQLGLLLLIATPIARVAFAALGFAMERDRTYVLVSLIVLATLLFSLAGGPR
jgi:uncharacterized membrane protein